MEIAAAEAVVTVKEDAIRHPPFFNTRSYIAGSTLFHTFL